VYQRLLDARLTPVSTTYTALISAYGKAGKLDAALDTFSAMVAAGCERSVLTYSALIGAAEKAGRWEAALALGERMAGDGCAPNTVTCNSLIMACAQGELGGRGLRCEGLGGGGLLLWMGQLV
jgi:pentatricopeptide repeat domain-containing protein 1